MSEVLFSGIRQAVRAFREWPSSPHPVIAEALNSIRSAEPGGAQLGFFRQARTPADPQRIERILAEQGKRLTPAQLAAVIDEYRRQSEQAGIRRQFIVQCIISAAVLAFAFWQLSRVELDADLQKALFGLIGTVLGYWLR